MIDTLIRKWEGCRLVAYKCSAGKWTIGWGSTNYADGKSVREGDEISQDLADALLINYIQKNIYPVFDKIPYKLTEDQKGAIASLCYNVGVPAFLKSKCFKAICEKDYGSIVKNWDWNKANGKVIKGLVKRRIEELYNFTKDI
ncbi:MAG: lysozyme [Bacteroidales bacterium]|nr:lysozyme [Candidatus Scybalousia scybalohippi]